MQSPPGESIRTGDTSCYNLDIESSVMEASRLQGFYDGVAVEASVKKSGGVEGLDFLNFSPFLPSFFFFSLAFWACFSALSLAFFLSLALWLRILFLSFSGRRLMSTSTSSSYSSPWLVPKVISFKLVCTQAFLTSSSSSGQ